jgi:copper(I)-binding protein
MKKHATFAPVTSVSLRRDGLHVMMLGNTDRRAVKKKATPTRRRAKP